MAFMPFLTKSKSHQDITRDAILQVTADVCKLRALQQGQDFVLDFYSHSNWIELGKREPYSNLIKPETPISNIADSETCRKCTGDTCTGNILEEVIEKQKLTSGYFGLSKPKGKCSHGGIFDLSSWFEGGISKDTDSSHHGYLHDMAASVATSATRELLEDIRAAIGDFEFLRLMGFSQTSVLCFVIDTTGSMGDDIDEVRRVTASIIDSKIDTAAQPSEYILVPFNDPDYGPLTRTTDPNLFKEQLNALIAHDGGDAPEMCLSGLQVTFMLTSGFSFLRHRRSVASVHRQQRASTGLFTQLNQVYHSLAQASGGQAIEVTKGTLDQATGIIADISSSTLVTLLQAVRNPGKAENFSAFVDTSVQNLTIYITGNSPYYTITSPSGVAQSSTELNGMLGLIQKVDINVTLLVFLVGGDSVRPTEITDFTAPVCEAVSVNANCSGNCSLSSWYLTANVTDGNGSIVQTVRILQGNGNLTTNTVLSDTGMNVTMVIYNASCCSSDLELVAVDEVGNVATCFKSYHQGGIWTTVLPNNLHIK
ncbi:hypothetical protein QTP86_000406 [Hemibagrus guttatus]|nr:hypothetical protein QTP86_000406 [Hemibagrus guttatus]